MYVPCTPIPPRCNAARHWSGGTPYRGRHDGTFSDRILICDGEATHGFMCEPCATKTVAELNDYGQAGEWSAVPLNLGHRHPDGHLVAVEIPGVTTPVRR